MDRDVLVCAIPLEEVLTSVTKAVDEVLVPRMIASLNGDETMVQFQIALVRQLVHNIARRTLSAAARQPERSLGDLVSLITRWILGSQISLGTVSV